MKIVSLSALIDGSWSLPNRSSLRSNLSISFEIGSSRKDCDLPHLQNAELGLDQDGSAIDHHRLTSAESFPHQEQIGLPNRSRIRNR